MVAKNDRVISDGARHGDEKTIWGNRDRHNRELYIVVNTELEGLR